MTIIRLVDTFIEERGMVAHHSLVDRDGSIETVVMGVWVQKDEHVIAFEVFASGGLPAARARFAELTSDGGSTRLRDR